MTQIDHPEVELGGGYTAQRVSPLDPLPYEPTAVFFMDRFGWIATDHGAILHTSDAGCTWLVQVHVPDCVLYDLRFIDHLRGLAVGAKVRSTGVSVWPHEFKSQSDGRAREAVVLHTVDGGRTWDEVYPELDDDLNRVWVDPVDGRALAVGDCGVITESTDGGCTWNSVGSPRMLDWLDVCMVGDQAGVLVARELAVRHALTEVDWVTEVPESGALYRTRDGGRSVQLVLRTRSSLLNAVAFLDELRGWAVGDGGSMYRTADGGETWEPVATGVKDRLFGICFADAHRGWAVGANGLVLVSQDGGASWRRDYVEEARSLRSVYASGGVAWAIGESGVWRIDSSPRDCSRHSLVRQFGKGDVLAVQQQFAHPGVSRTVARLPYLFDDPWGLPIIKAPMLAHLHRARSAWGAGLVATHGTEVKGCAFLELIPGYSRCGTLRLTLGVAESSDPGVSEVLLTHVTEVVRGWLPAMRVECFVMPQDEATLDLLGRHGFSVDGRLRDYLLVAGVPTDVLLLSRVRLTRRNP